MTKSELRKYAKDRGITLAEARQIMRDRAAASTRVHFFGVITDGKDNILANIDDKMLLDEETFNNYKEKNTFGFCSPPAGWANSEDTPNEFNSICQKVFNQFFQVKYNKETDQQILGITYSTFCSVLHALGLVIEDYQDVWITFMKDESRDEGDDILFVFGACPRSFSDKERDECNEDIVAQMQALVASEWHGLDGQSIYDMSRAQMRGQTIRFKDKNGNIMLNNDGSPMEVKPPKL